MNISSISGDLAAQTLAAEMSDVEASIELVASGLASGVTLSGLHFGRKIAELLEASAAQAGVELETDLWADDSLAAEVHVRAYSAERARWPHA
jgi:hypothetical protein